MFILINSHGKFPTQISKIPHLNFPRNGKFPEIYQKFSAPLQPC